VQILPPAPDIDVRAQLTGQDKALESINNPPMSTGTSIEAWLESFLQARGAVAGTVHTREADDDALRLRAAVRIPPKVQEITRLIPKGKGMAGLAWERRVPVTTCNLQEDGSGDVRPGAKAVAAQAAVAIPVQDASGEVRAVVGIAFPDEREFEDSTLAEFATAAASLP
jgi:hypothetical protein